MTIDPAGSRGLEHSPKLVCKSASPLPGAPQQQHLHSNAAIIDHQHGGLQLAEVLLAGGKAADALAHVDAALLLSPGSGKLLHLRSKCLMAAGNVTGAFASLMSVLAAAPHHLDALLDLASLYVAKGLLVEARDVLLRASEVAPGDKRVGEALATVLTDLGTAAKGQGRLEEAVAAYHAALEACPTLAAAHYNLGVVASEAGRERWPDALQHYQRAVECSPSYAQAHCNAGVIHREEGRLEEAVAAYQRALQAAPSFDLVRGNLATALTDLGTLTKARGDVAGGIALYERALALAPRHADALYNLGVALAEAGPCQSLDRALFCYHTAVSVRPECAEAWNNAGVIYRERGELERACECYLAALNIRPNFPQALNNLGVLYTSQGRTGEATALLRAATQAAPAYAEAWNNLGVVQRDIGEVADAIASYQRAASLAPEQPNAAQNRLLALNYAHPGENPWVCEQHAAWGRDFQARIPRMPPVVPRVRGGWPASRPLRVGYVSPDLFVHSVSYFAEAPLTHHNRSAVAVTVYDSTPRRDAKSARMRQQAEAAGATWRCVEGLDDAALAELVRSDAMDVLVELTGHTAHNRLAVMAARPAPVQVTWIGYPNSTGLEAIDYRITDSTCDPLDTQQTFVEELVRLPDCFLCYTPPSDAPSVAPPPAEGRGFVTFGSFNALAKFTDDVLALWARVLAAVPGSRLVLKNKPFACAQARAHWAARLAALGVEPWRVDLIPLAPSNAEHLAQYSLLDVALDPFPYAGTTTTAEALFMGVPVLSMAGGCHAHNVGASLLGAVGLRDWVVRSADDYVARAVAAAADVPALAALRAGMRQRILASPLCDAPRFVHQLERAYGDLYSRWAAKEGAPAAEATPGIEASTADGCQAEGSSGRSSGGSLGWLGSSGSSSGGSSDTEGRDQGLDSAEEMQQQQQKRQQQREKQQQQQRDRQREQPGQQPRRCEQQHHSQRQHGAKRASDS